MNDDQTATRPDPIETPPARSTPLPEPLLPCARHGWTIAHTCTGPREYGPRGFRALGIADQLTEHHGLLDLRGQVLRDAGDLAALAQTVRDPRIEPLHYIYTQRQPDGTDRVVATEALSSRLAAVSHSVLAEE